MGKEAACSRGVGPNSAKAQAMKSEMRGEIVRARGSAEGEDSELGRSVRASDPVDRKGQRKRRGSETRRATYCTIVGNVRPRFALDGLRRGRDGAGSARRERVGRRRRRRKQVLGRSLLEHLLILARLLLLCRSHSSALRLLGRFLLRLLPLLLLHLALELLSLLGNVRKSTHQRHLLGHGGFRSIVAQDSLTLKEDGLLVANVVDEVLLVVQLGLPLLSQLLFSDASLDAREELARSLGGAKVLWCGTTSASRIGRGRQRWRTMI